MPSGHSLQAAFVFAVTDSGPSGPGNPNYENSQTLSCTRKQCIYILSALVPVILIVAALYNVTGRHAVLRRTYGSKHHVSLKALLPPH